MSLWQSRTPGPGLCTDDRASGKAEARRVPPLSPSLIYLIKISGNSQSSGISTEAATPKARGEPNVQQAMSGAGVEVMPPGATGSPGQQEPLPQGLELGWGHGAGWARAAFCPPRVPGPPSSSPHQPAPSSSTPGPDSPASDERRGRQQHARRAARARNVSPTGLAKIPQKSAAGWSSRSAESESQDSQGWGAVRTPWDGAVLAPVPAPAGARPGPPEALLPQVLPWAGFMARSMANPSKMGIWPLLATLLPPPGPGAAVWQNPAHSDPVFVLPPERGRCHLTELVSSSSSWEEAQEHGIQRLNTTREHVQNQLQTANRSFLRARSPFHVPGTLWQCPSPARLPPWGPRGHREQQCLAPAQRCQPGWGGVGGFLLSSQPGPCLELGIAGAGSGAGPWARSWR